jgi:hypothetical protein
MRNITGEELEEVLRKNVGKSFANVLEELIPGFNKFVADTIFTELMSGQNESAAILFAFASHRQIDRDLLVELKDAFKLMVAVGWLMHQVESERVPAGTTIH